MVSQRTPSSWHLQLVQAMSTEQKQFAKPGFYRPGECLSSFLGCQTTGCLLQVHAQPPKDVGVQRTGEMKDKREEKTGTSQVAASVSPLVERLVKGRRPMVY